MKAIAAVLATTALTASVSLAADAAYAWPIRNPSPDGVVMGVTGWTNNGYVRREGATSWSNWSGKLKGAPAVIERGGVTHMIGTDLATGRLTYRNNYTGWGEITTSGACNKPVVAGRPSSAGGSGDFWMACVGNNGHAYIRKLDGVTQGNQEVVRLTDVGTPSGAGSTFESLSLGVYSQPNELDGVVVVGTGSADDMEGNTYRMDRNAEVPVDREWRGMGLRCDGDIAMATASAANFEETNMCQANNLMLLWVVNREGNVMNEFTLPGQARGKVGLAEVNGSGAFVAGVQGLTDSIPRYRVLGGQNDSPGWIQLGGLSRGGVTVGQQMAAGVTP